MKKILQIISVFLLVFLVGCSEKEGSKVYVKKQPGVQMEITLYYKGDVVTKQTAKNIITYSEVGLTKEAFKKQAEKFGEKFKGIKGLEDKVDYQDNIAVETVTVDYSIADINELKGLPWPSSGDKKVSLKKTEEKLIEERFDEKK